MGKVSKVKGKEINTNKICRTILIISFLYLKFIYQLICGNFILKLSYERSCCCIHSFKIILNSVIYPNSYNQLIYFKIVHYCIRTLTGISSKQASQKSNSKVLNFHSALLLAERQLSYTGQIKPHVNISPEA